MAHYKKLLTMTANQAYLHTCQRQIEETFRFFHENVFPIDVDG